MLGRVFKAYDIRGVYPDLLTDRMAWQIGCGTARYLLEEAESDGETTPMMRNVLVGHDMRVSSPKLNEELIRGLNSLGASVIDLGMIDTPMMYFAINYLDCAGGVVVTASHNPPQYNGFKISKRKAKPVGETTGLSVVRKHAAMVDKNAVPLEGTSIDQRDLWDAYRKHVLKFLDLGGKSLKIVVDASNGMAGTMCPKIFGTNGDGIDGLEIIEMNFENTKHEYAHEPNPLVASNLAGLQEAVIANKADLGLCFDGDADRCVAVDEQGKIVPCDLMTALLAGFFLEKHPGSAVIYDLRSTKAVKEEIEKHGGTAHRGRVGHVFMKHLLAEKKAIFGGELSGHFYFRKNFNADSGAIAMATFLSVLAASKKPMSAMIKPLARYFQSSEINFEIEEKDEALEQVMEEFAERGEIDELDGITIDAFEELGWWMNIRKSNTEPLLRLNAEAKDAETLEALIAEVSPMLGTRVDH
ncbi:MAG: phosphomannomutase/phosphoglucomutase [Phycisphaerales bacterium]|nr:phosphomannomutase/phosphoglucomutase [Phycisphaerales bacterium]